MANESPFAVDTETTKKHDLDFAKELAGRIDPWNFYVKTEDKNGHSAQLRARCPKWWLGMVEHIISKVEDYKCSADFVRDAVFHRATWLMKNVENIDPAVLAPFLVQQESERVAMESASMKTLSKNLSSVTAILARAKDWEGLFRFLDVQYKNAAGLREPYRARILSRLNRLRLQYGERMRDGDKDPI